jgi:hypothetical protein
MENDDFEIRILSKNGTNVEPLGRSPDGDFEMTVRKIDFPMKVRKREIIGDKDNLGHDDFPITVIQRSWEMKIKKVHRLGIGVPSDSDFPMKVTKRPPDDGGIRILKHYPSGRGQN